MTAGADGHAGARAPAGSEWEAVLADLERWVALVEGELAVGEPDADLPAPPLDAAPPAAPPPAQRARLQRLVQRVAALERALDDALAAVGRQLDELDHRRRASRRYLAVDPPRG